MNEQTIHFYRPAKRTGDALAPCVDCGEYPTEQGFGDRHEPSRSQHEVAYLNDIDDDTDGVDPRYTR